MKTRCLFGLAAFVFFLPLALAEEPPAGFTPLFNGKDLTGWQVHGGKIEQWGVEDGLLITKGGGGGWLMTEKEYADFELRLEYRVPKMGNSGVCLRSPLKGDPAYTGMEIQILDDPNWAAQKLKPTQMTGSIYGVVPAAKSVVKEFGEWNAFRIVAKGRKVMIELNGTTIVDANLDEYKEHEKSHPGLTRASGHIGLQSYSKRTDFRNIYVKPLD